MPLAEGAGRAGPLPTICSDPRSPSVGRRCRRGPVWPVAGGLRAVLPAGSVLAAQGGVRWNACLTAAPQLALQLFTKSGPLSRKRRLCVRTEALGVGFCVVAFAHTFENWMKNVDTLTAKPRWEKTPGRPFSCDFCGGPGGGARAQPAARSDGSPAEESSALRAGVSAATIIGIPWF